MKKIAICTLAAALLMQTGLAAFADEPAGGPLTRSGNPIWTIGSFPLRLTTGVGGMVVGAVVNGSKNVVKTEQEFASNTFAKGNENPVLYPVGLIGSVVAVPVGFITGMPEGASMGGRTGYKLWDHL